METHTKNLTEFYTPEISKSLSFIHFKIPDPGDKLDYSIESNNEIFQNIPSGIIDGAVINT